MVDHEQCFTHLCMNNDSVLSNWSWIGGKNFHLLCLFMRYDKRLITVTSYSNKSMDDGWNKLKHVFYRDDKKTNKQKKKKQTKNKLKNKKTVGPILDSNVLAPTLSYVFPLCWSFLLPNQNKKADLSFYCPSSSMFCPSSSSTHSLLLHLLYIPSPPPPPEEKFSALTVFLILFGLCPREGLAPPLQNSRVKTKGNSNVETFLFF